ncbi:MAG: hypothetical protein ACPHY8_03170 [Patescibacteria group bacterium]
MKKVFILVVLVYLSACSSLEQYDSRIFVDNKKIDEISYFLNRLECHDLFDMCVTKNFDMYISKNNDTLVMQNQDMKLLIFNYTKQEFTTIQLNQAHQTYFLKYNPVEQEDIEGNKKILSAINQARLSLGYEY